MSAANCKPSHAVVEVHPEKGLVLRVVGPRLLRAANPKQKPPAGPAAK